MKLPNWKNKEEYEYINKIKRVEVAWEFLRRNRDFRADLKSLKDGTVVDENGNPPVKLSKSMHNFGETTEGFYWPPFEEGETFSEWFQNCIAAEIKPDLISAEQYILRKWQMKGAVPDPDISSNEESFYIASAPPETPRIIQLREDLFDLEWEDVGLTEALHKNNIVVVFSMEKAITTQWKEISKQLSNLRKAYNDVEKKLGRFKGESSKKSPSWIPALRAWDSHEANPELFITDRVVILYGEVTNTNKANLRNHRKQAEDMISEGYRDLL